jgi:DeoR family ulaG and ulaABCDEF operon transcriptional repressor
MEQESVMSATDSNLRLHANERDQVILDLLDGEGFVSFRELSRHLPAASPATLRRDLERLQSAGKLHRVRGGAQPAAGTRGGSARLQGIPFHENIGRNRAAKQAIGLAAARLCRVGEAIIIDGGSTTLTMCPHLESLRLQVLTNSLHIVSALLHQPHTGVSIPGGMVFREQNIILEPFGQDDARVFHAARLFVGAAAVSHHGLMQNDVILVQAERKLLNQADSVVAMVDSSKFRSSAPHVLCELWRVNTLITDDGIDPDHAKMVRQAGVELIVAPVPS